MINTLTSQQVDLWEAWVDLHPSEGFATLYVIGNVYTNNRLTQPFFVKKDQHDASLLQLEIHPSICSDEGFETEIMFAEELCNLCEYNSIEIYAGHELVTKITGLETFC